MSNLSAKLYGNEYMQQTAEGKHIKMIWIDRASGLVGPQCTYKYPRYVLVSELMHMKESALFIELNQQQLTAAQSWLANQAEQTRIKVQPCIVSNKGVATYPVRAATPKEIEKEDRDVRFWLQVYGANPDSIQGPDAAIRRATKLYAMETSHAPLDHNGYFYSRKGPIFQNLRAHIATEGIASIVPTEPLDDNAELINGVLKMRGYINNKAF